MLVNYSNLKFISSLNNYDIVNKFNYTNYYVIPNYVVISFKIFIKSFLNINFFNLYLKNYLLLFLFCFKIINCNLKFKKLKRKKSKLYKIKLCLSSICFKNNILSHIFNLFFLFKKFARPLYFSNHNLTFLNTSGKCFSSYSKLITFLPSFMLLDSKEHKYFPTFKESKIFLELSLKNIYTTSFYNFFSKKKLFSKQYLKNFLMIWCLI